MHGESSLAAFYSYFRADLYPSIPFSPRNPPPAYYTSTAKQVLDVHEEALRIRESNKSTSSEGVAHAEDEKEKGSDIAGVESTSAPVVSTGLASEKGPSGTTTA